MEKENKSPDTLFGLIGKNISYSFSRGYFTEKFRTLHLEGYNYVNFDLPDITAFPDILKEHPRLKGLNVTIPYKEKVLPYLNELSEEAQRIGAVNTIAFTKNGLKGYNTDAYGFKEAFFPLVKPHHKKALVLGSGGASKAVIYILKEMGIPYLTVSRNKPEMIHYEDIKKETLEEYTILINCTPLGTLPDVEAKPVVPYQYLTPKHLLYDLVYNPAETAFLQEGKARGATICNGLQMLKFQAEKAWELWNK